MVSTWERQAPAWQFTAKLVPQFYNGEKYLMKTEVLVLAIDNGT